MRLLVVVVVAVVVAGGCVEATPSILRWRPDDQTLAITVPLGYASGPTASQHHRAQAIARSRCPDGFDLVEEGSDPHTSRYLSVSGGIAVAGETTTKTYYWVVKCRPTDPK